MTDEVQPPPAPRSPGAPRLSPQVDHRRESTASLLSAGAIVLSVGAAGVIVLLGAGLTATQGARASTRLQWERRKAEIDRVATDAEARGKLHDGRAESASGDAAK